MLLECRRMNEFFGSTMSRITLWLKRRVDLLTAAKAEVKAAKSDGDKVDVMTAYARLRKAEADLEDAKKKHRVLLLKSARPFAFGVLANPLRTACSGPPR